MSFCNNYLFPEQGNTSARVGQGDDPAGQPSGDQLYRAHRAARQHAQVAGEGDRGQDHHPREGERQGGDSGPSEWAAAPGRG
jgi:hypothetical protein